MTNVQNVHQKGRKEMFNLMMNTFYLWLYWIYGKRPLGKRWNLLLSLHRLLFPINNKRCFTCTIPHRIAHSLGFINKLCSPKIFILKVCRKGRREMFYLMTHWTHFILRLYGIGHMVKDHSDSERGNLLLPHGLLFPISSKGSFTCTIPQTG